LQAVLSGTVDLAVLAPEETGGMVQSGELRALAVCSAERIPILPNVPTLREQGWNVVVENMKGLNAPAGLPDEIYTSLHDRFRRAMQEPAWTGFLERTGTFAGYLDGPAYQAAMDAVLDGLRASVRR
jgi:tripartite-type tricarboxylate transporter receptor subunit TctC